MNNYDEARKAMEAAGYPGADSDGKIVTNAKRNYDEARKAFESRGSLLAMARTLNGAR